MKVTNVTFMGLGLMGSGMAHRLLGAGYSLTVFNRSAEKARPLVDLGARLANTPAEAAADAHVIFSMLADDDASRKVWLGRESALGAAPTGSILVECSTVTPGWIDELDRAARGRNLELVDAPVTGSKTHAAGGQLLFLAGGSPEALERIRPVLEAMSRGIVHLGPIGSGARLKLINNFVCGVQAASLAEALNLIERSGLNVQQALQILAEGAPGSPLFKMLSGRMLEHAYEPHFALQLMAKDLRYASQEAKRLAQNLATAAAALTVFENAIAGGYGEKDMSSVIEPMRQDAKGGVRGALA